VERELGGERDGGGSIDEERGFCGCGGESDEEGEVLHAQLITSLASLRLERAKLATRSPIQKASVRSLQPNGTYKEKIFPNLFQ
jgi:hypothetical protein